MNDTKMLVDRTVTASSEYIVYFECILSVLMFHACLPQLQGFSTPTAGYQKFCSVSFLFADLSVILKLSL